MVEHYCISVGSVPTVSGVFTWTTYHDWMFIKMEYPDGYPATVDVYCEDDE